MVAFPSRDTTSYKTSLRTSLLDESCTGVGIEPTLQPLSNEQMRLKSANVDDGTRLEVIAGDFWSTRQRAFF